MKNIDKETKDLKYLQDAIDDIKRLFYTTIDGGIIYLKMASDLNHDEKLMYDRIKTLDDEELADTINQQLKIIRTACKAEKAQQLVHNEIENLVKLQATKDIASGSNHFQKLLNSASKTGGISK